MYSNISQILLLYKTWGFYNKFDSTKSLGVDHITLVVELSPKTCIFYIIVIVKDMSIITAYFRLILMEGKVNNWRDRVFLWKSFHFCRQNVMSSLCWIVSRFEIYSKVAMCRWTILKIQACLELLSNMLTHLWMFPSSSKDFGKLTVVVKHLEIVVVKHLRISPVVLKYLGMLQVIDGMMGVGVGSSSYDSSS